MLNKNVDIPVRLRTNGKYVMTKEDKAYIKSFAVNGIISFADYVRACNEILNRERNTSI